MKKVLILRGLPGSGKSTYAKSRMEAFLVSSEYTEHRNEGYPRIWSADDFHFNIEGVWEFNPANIGATHQACFRGFLASLQKNAPLIIVDNTNTQRFEISPYYLAAEAFGYEVQIVAFNVSVEESLARNIHNVPEKTIIAMRGHWEDALPWWNETWARGICNATK